MKHCWFCFALLLSMGSCDSSDSSSFSIQFMLKAGADDFALETPYHLNGKSIVFTTCNMYVSSPTLKSGEQISMQEDESIFLITPYATKWVFSTPSQLTDTITELSWGMGIPASRNDSAGLLAQPAYSYPSGHPLSVENDMYWGWNPGYVFLKLEGRYDQNGNGLLNEVGETFSIHTGLNAGYVRIAIPLHTTSNQITITADILRFFDAYDLGTYPNVHPFSAQSPEFPLSLIIQQNAQQVFKAL